MCVFNFILIIRYKNFEYLYITKKSKKHFLTNFFKQNPGSWQVISNGDPIHRSYKYEDNVILAH